MTSIACPLLLAIVLFLNILNDRTLSHSLPLPAAVEYGSTLSCAFAADGNDVVIRDGWVQEGPPSQTITAAYMVIENHTGDEISLQSASSEVAQAVELHKMQLIDGMMKMQRVEKIGIPAGGSIELKPGGYHLMVIGLKKQLKEGDTAQFILQFSNDLRKTIRLPVKPRNKVENQN